MNLMPRNLSRKSKNLPKMIFFDKVTKRFPNDTLAIEEVTFEVEPGEFVYISGPSGAVKTTLGRLMIGEMIPSSGDLRVGDYDLTNLDKKDLPFLRRQIGFVFQDFKLLPDRTAAENIALSLEILDKAMDEVYTRVEELMVLTGLEGKGDLFPNQLSGGEAQRAVIARAIASDPAVLFADEPTGNLDTVTARAIVDLLDEINKAGTTVVMATHDEDLMSVDKTRHIKLEKGKLVEDTGAKKKLVEEKKDGKVDGDKVKADDKDVNKEDKDEKKDKNRDKGDRKDNKGKDKDE